MIMFFDPLQNTLENKVDSMAEILKKPHEINFNSFTLNLISTIAIYGYIPPLFYLIYHR